MNKQNRNRPTDTEKKLVAARGDGLWDWVKKIKGSGNRNWYLQNSRGDVDYSAGNTVNDTVISTCEGRWVFEISGGPLCKVRDCRNTMVHT